MKFIHLTDTHIVGDGLLYGEDPAQRLRSAVASINEEHGDAAFVVHTGDITHQGEAAAYEVFTRETGKLKMPIHLMVGNHDQTPALQKAIPYISRDENGFVQTSLTTAYGRFLLLDTTVSGTHAGGFCAHRQDWLKAQLESNDGPVFLFMHHPPFSVGIKAMDKIMMQDDVAFYDILAPHQSRIRHLFFGHLHRAVSGNWRGISFSCLRGLNHQVALDLDAPEDKIAGTFEPPTYGVVLLDQNTVTVHLHDFTDASERFIL